MRKRAAVCVAAATLAGGVIVAITTGPAAHAATTACGPSCVELYEYANGNTDILAVDSGPVQTGLGTELYPPSETEATEDFVLSEPGTVADFYSDGWLNATVDAAWSTDETYEWIYAPNGQQTSLCLGIANNASSGEQTSLQPCGVDMNTVWIALAADKVDDGFMPLASATDTSVNAPYVLTEVPLILRYPLSLSTPPKLVVNPLTTVDGTFSGFQVWTDEVGVVGHNPLR
jgi:hypothetical protein